ncbi:MAG: phosphate ABC transporter permease subunit PstC [Acidobacteriaceae bacterium]|nr:phosphate ABC transporter permease subunit PstC [Acidobacteriaceae bacterium]MBV9779203.1 phosphate ABC transporter permease subunit PstC [Acidobacteriaceae bacterium]
MASTTYLPRPAPRAPGPAARPTFRSFYEQLRGGDVIAYPITLLCATAILAIVGLLIVELWIHSQPTVQKFGWHFLTTTTWDPNGGQFGALPFIYGTCVTSFVALLIAVPLGVAASIFLAEMAPPKLSNVLTFLIELLAAVPSVIYGLIGIFVLVPLIRGYLAPALKGAFGFLPIFQGDFFGVSFLSAGLVLSVMVVPFIISVSREVLLAVPVEQREAALALGATKWETTWQVVIPYASTGIIGSIFLALARALGETMAVTMVIGNTPKIAASLFSPGYSIAAVIANEFAEASGQLYTSSLIFLGLVLFGLTIVINAVARLFILATSRKRSVSP